MDDSVVAALIDIGSQWQSNLLNLGYNELNYWRSRRQEERLWAREDSAVQRRVEDLKKAGLNPLLAAGSPAASGMVSQHYGSPNFGVNMGELMDVVKNNYEAIKDQQVAQADLLQKESVKREAEIDLINSQKVEAEAKTLEALSRAKNVDVKTRESAYNLGLYEALNLPTNSSGFMKDFGLAQSYGNLWFDNLMNLFSGDKKDTKESKDKKSFDRLPKKSYNQEDIMKSFEKAKEKNKRFAH